jgi:hypothetical protein
MHFLNITASVIYINHWAITVYYFNIPGYSMSNKVQKVMESGGTRVSRQSVLTAH